MNCVYHNDNNDYVFVKMLGDVGLHQTAAQTLRSSLLSAQSEQMGGFVTARDGSAGMTATVV